LFRREILISWSLLAVVVVAFTTLLTVKAVAVALAV
jgi:hypothetical protein